MALHKSRSASPRPGSSSDLQPFQHFRQLWAAAPSHLQAHWKDAEKHLKVILSRFRVLQFRGLGFAHEGLHDGHTDEAVAVLRDSLPLEWIAG